MTIVTVTNCLRVGSECVQDLGDLFKQAKDLPGFVRINFSAADKNSSTIQFKSAHDAALALVTSMTDIRDVSFHSVPANKSEANPPPLRQTAKPSQVLYVRMMKGMTPEGLRKIVESLDGFTQFQHAKTFGKIYFVSEKHAANASQRLWTETNIYAFFHHMKSDMDADSSIPGVPGLGQDAGSTTVHVQSLDRDFAGLYKLFLELPGGSRIGYHKNYIFLCFDTHKSAKTAVSHINTTTYMKARTVEFDYSPHFTPGSLGIPGKTVRMNFITVFPKESEIHQVFATYAGFERLHYTSKKCWATFSSVTAATECLKHFNQYTNIKVVFCNKLSSDARR
ncbi:hypothetical protein CcCBS67573_g08949 [Chytriomyces confervae]|uniref:Uncharacterized protein n=1 Tax=Chytriomyces confervae TaxID=246404 RepID=A0A507ECZ4_9FUNG|nr:hypothetical protein HDU80_007821 [Chytriomyces hyalinus]TPX61235.1 hypothetical protein CcCBS67573_g08949 [Chytriomyces confervae]